MDSLSQSHPNKTTMRAYLTSSIFFIAAAALVLGLIDLLSTSSSDALSTLLGSPWGISALADYAVGAVFGVMFLWIRQPPPMLFINHKVIAVVFPFAGNFLLLLYMSYVIYTYKSVELAFIPKSVASEGEPVYEPPANRRQTKIIGFLFMALLVFFVAVTLWAFNVESISDGLRDFRHKSVSFTFLDNLGGLLFTFVYVLVREEAASAVIPWFLAFAFLGNAATMAYVIKLAYQSIRQDTSFTFLLLSRSKGH